jgi:hypothetical protein
VTRRTIAFDVVAGWIWPGVPTLMRVPVIAESMPHELREGLARRRIVAAGHKCPCGASFDTAEKLTYRDGSDIPTMHIGHDENCPGSDNNAIPMLQRWADGGDP